jgi:predicted phage baseplate assembly protein
MPRQVFFLRQPPVLPGEVIEVRELEGARAHVELPILEEALRRAGVGPDALNVVRDRQSGRVTEVWVRWQAQPHFFFSGPDDRHYVIERSQGRVLFGDGVHGRIPPPAADNIVARRYRSGGGLGGNVPAGAIRALLAPVPFAQGVASPRGAEGGADGERSEGVAARGARTLHHRRQAIGPADWEALAREASPAVAVARALPATHPSGRPAPGWVTVIVMPQSHDPRPQPSFELRRLVREFLAARSPAALGGRIGVIGPTYLPVGVEAVVVPVRAQDAGPVVDTVRAQLATFLHPVTGGPDGDGWPFGRDVYLSDVAAILERLPGVDYVRELTLLIDDTPQGERTSVPPDRIVVAGELRVRPAGREG